MSYFYRLFGYLVESDFEIVQATLMGTELNQNQKVDIRILRTELTETDVKTEYDCFWENKATFSIDGIGLFRVTGGRLIEVKPLSEDMDHLSVFLTGSCMGAILHQRKEFVLHGSVVTNGIRTVLFTGKSGAGKSTAAAEFCSHGWKLMTDDVAVIKNPESERLVQPSYPSQKLWEDSLSRFYQDDHRIHSLYKRNSSEKYGIKAEDFFTEERMPLTDVFLICPEDLPESENTEISARIHSDESTVQICSLTDLEKIKILMDQTYRPYMIFETDLQKHFQACVTMSLKLHMAAVIRSAENTSPDEMYQKLIQKLNQ